MKPSITFLASLLGISVATFDYEQVANDILADNSSPYDDVVEGYNYFFTLNDCLRLVQIEENPFGAPGTCYANNPSSPYGMLMLPLRDEELAYPDAGYFIEEDKNGKTYSMAWRLKEADVVILMGKTPPECKYFGFTNYLYSRFHEAGWTPDESVDSYACPDGPARCEIFSSPGDAVNLGNINPDVDASPFNAEFVNVMAMGETYANEAKQYLMDMGVPEDRINLYPFPGSEFKLGLHEEADVMTSLLRNAFIKDPTEKANFYDTSPFVALRMTSRLDGSQDLYPRPNWIDRKTEIDDATPTGLTLDQLSDKLEEVIGNMIDSYEPRTEYQYFRSEMEAGVPDNGFICNDLGKMCQGDTRDTFYPATTGLVQRGKICESLPTDHSDWPAICRPAALATLTEDDGDFMVFCGVNHFETGMAKYSSMSIYNYEKLQGVKSVTNDEYFGTANAYLEDQELAKYFYCYKFMRNCPADEDGKSCFSVPKTGDTAIPVEDDIVFIERMYNNPVTGIGPSPDMVLAARLVHFNLNGPVSRAPTPSPVATCDAECCANLISDAPTRPLTRRPTNVGGCVDQDIQGDFKPYTCDYFEEANLFPEYCEYPDLKAACCECKKGDLATCPGLDDSDWGFGRLKGVKGPGSTEIFTNFDFDTPCMCANACESQGGKVFMYKPTVNKKSKCRCYAGPRAELKLNSHSHDLVGSLVAL